MAAISSCDPETQEIVWQKGASMYGCRQFRRRDLNLRRIRPARVVSAAVNACTDDHSGSASGLADFDEPAGPE
jgi:hypothetical protein